MLCSAASCPFHGVPRRSDCAVRKHPSRPYLPACLFVHVHPIHCHLLYMDDDSSVHLSFSTRSTAEELGPYRGLPGYGKQIESRAGDVEGCLQKETGLWSATTTQGGSFGSLLVARNLSAMVQGASCPSPFLAKPGHLDVCGQPNMQFCWLSRGPSQTRPPLLPPYPRAWGYTTLHWCHPVLHPQGALPRANLAMDGTL